MKNVIQLQVVKAALLAAAIGMGAANGALAATQGQAAPLPAAKVNVNTADAATLAQVLVGIGQSKAEAIVAYRKEHGEFTSVDQIAEVKGIGKSTMEKNRERIQLK